jgi:hypothetical protein
MSRAQWGGLALFSGLLAALVAPAETPREYRRTLASAPADARLAAATLPRFARFGWVSPPLESTTVARYAELAGAGFNTAVLAWEDSGRVADNRARLSAARGTSLKMLLFDRDLDRDPLGSAAWNATLDTVAARYRDDPGFLGYYLGDEPSESEFASLGSYFAALRARDPAHPAWNNLLGRSAFTSHADFETYVRRYVAAAHPAVLCDDQYEFLESGDRLQLVENAATLGAIARENAIPFWGIVLLVKHDPYREVTDGMLRWQVAQWLAYGAHGIGIFTYWTPAPDPRYDWQPAMIEWGSGARTPKYDMVRTLNTMLAPLGDTLAAAQWLGAVHAGSTPPGGVAFTPGALIAGVEGRATIGYFADVAAAPLVLVGNADSLAAATLRVRPAEGRTVTQLDADGLAWTPLTPDAGGSVALDLAPGDFTLLKLSGSVDSLVVGRAPRLVASPNPALASVVFSAQGLSGPARLELFDVGGRRLWSRALSGASATATWGGAGPGGERVRAGALFARLEDAHGASVRRIAWLGGP